MFQYKFNEAECRYLNKSFISRDIKSLPGGKYLLPSMPTSHITAMAAIYYWCLTEIFRKEDVKYFKSRGGDRVWEGTIIKDIY